MRALNHLCKFFSRRIEETCQKKLFEGSSNTLRKRQEGYKWRILHLAQFQIYFSAFRREGEKKNTWKGRKVTSG